MSKEFIGFRIDKRLYDVVVYIRAKTGLSITQIMTNALIDYINHINLDDELERLRLEVERERKREENKRLLRGITLINNQAKLLRKLRMQGVEEEKIKEYAQALREEARLYGLDLEYEGEAFKVVFHANNK